MGMGGTAAHGNTYPQPPSASVLTLRPTTPKPDKSDRHFPYHEATLLEGELRCALTGR